MRGFLRLVRDASPVPFTQREIVTAAVILESRARHGRHVVVSDEFAREVARALRELVAMKRRAS